MKFHLPTVINVQGKPTHTIIVRIILYRIYHTLGNFHFQIPYLKIFTTDYKEGKIGRDDDPLFNHPYFQILIKEKQHEFDLNEEKLFKARYDLVVKSTISGSTDLNKSTAHSEEHRENCNGTKNPIIRCSKFKKFKNKSANTPFKLPTRSDHNLKRGTTIRILSKPGFPKKVSEETETIFNDLLTFLAQEICDKTLVP